MKNVEGLNNQDIVEALTEYWGMKPMNIVSVLEYYEEVYDETPNQ